MDRYELKTGKFGQYFHDREFGTDMPLEQVLNLMNNKTQTSSVVLGVQFDAIDLNKTLTVKGYLKELLFQLITEQENFSGKRPFGESGWICGIEKALIEAGIVQGEIDEDGFVKRINPSDFRKKMINAIKDM